MSVSSLIPPSRVTPGRGPEVTLQGEQSTVKHSGVIVVAGVKDKSRFASVSPVSWISGSGRILGTLKSFVVTLPDM